MNLQFGQRSLQVLLWWRLEDIKDRWALKAWRWPSDDTRRDAAAAGMTNFGFAALTLGPLEFRYWARNPNPHPPATSSGGDGEKMTATEILKKPYTRYAIREAKGGYSAAILEFPGCITCADTADEAFTRLEDVAESWLLATMERGQSVPQPGDVPSKWSVKLMMIVNDGPFLP